MLEFDVWLTPTLGEIRDTERFQKEMESAVLIFEVLGRTTDKFSMKKKPDIRKIAEAVELEIAGADKKRAKAFLVSIADLVYLVSGKSDNNCKCQLPIYIRQRNIFNRMPVVNNGIVQYQSWPRVIKAEQFMKTVADLGNHQDLQTELIHEFFEFILSDEAYVAQLWAIGNCYFSLKPYHKEKSLLSPLVIFKIRGSVTASGGHDPEQLLRTMMADWGMRQGVDYNNDDVVVDSLVSTPKAVVGSRTKIRKYDFVLPFKTTGWQPNLFVQCQFYAGDSGSVSHKNVDQTSSARGYTAKHFQKARFVEFVDGAGYFASLNGDLKTLLQMKNTHSFFQIKSASIRLRRELQHIGYLMPLDVEHALFCSAGDKKKATKLLLQDGYSSAEIERVVSFMLEEGLLRENGCVYAVSAERIVTSRRYLLLDVIAMNGSVLSTQEKGYVLVPGYGPFYGIKLKELPKLATKCAMALTSEIGDTSTFLADIEWLAEKGFVMIS
ncbi:MAG: hypothetical protein V1791_07655 [Pseudomonadota bacterium]